MNASDLTKPSASELVSGAEQRGRHGGILIGSEGGQIEIGIYRRRMPPRFELFFYDRKHRLQLPPIGVTLEIERPDGGRQTFRFARFGYSLESTIDVSPPFEFSVRITLPREGSLLVHTVQFARYPVAPDTAPEPTSNGRAMSWNARLREIAARRLNRAPTEDHSVAGRVSSLLLSAAREQTADVMEALETAPTGLSDGEVERRAEVYGANEVGREQHLGPLIRLWGAIRNPLVILLVVLAILSYATGDARAGTVMVLMVLVGVSLRFVQESRRRFGGGEAPRDDPRDGNRAARR